MLKSLLLSLSILLFSTQVFAADAYKQVPNAQKVGEARLTYMLWNVYDASLYAPKGKWNAQKTYALSLDYLRKLNGKAIAERSVEEMRKQGYKNEIKLAAWFSQMKNIFPNVKNKTNITGVYYPNSKTIFYKNGKKIGEVNDDEFGKRFFGIWLNKETSEPALRKQLLGLS